MIIIYFYVLAAGQIAIFGPSETEKLLREAGSAQIFAVKCATVRVQELPNHQWIPRGFDAPDPARCDIVKMRVETPKPERMLVEEGARIVDGSVDTGKL